MRKDLGDIQGLAQSIDRHGLIQPIVLDHENYLIAGERRLRAHELLKKEEIDFVYREQVPVDVQAELEFEENYWRKSMSWQEEALGILNIYRKKKLASALEGWIEPYQQVVAQMFGMSVGTVNYVLAVAKKLEQEKDPKGRWHSFNNASEAYRLGILADEEERITAFNAEQTKKQVNTVAQQQEAAKVAEQITQITESPDLLAFERERYAANPLNTTPFDEYWAEKQKYANEVKNTIYISNRFFHGDCIAFMSDPSRIGMFDHIVTDPPYAIDVSLMNQESAGGKMVDIDRLEDAHQVEENMELLKKFFPAAWQCTGDKAFVIVCCDISQWTFLKALAEGSGFAVQEWPYIWKKPSAMNNCAQYNTTKDYEIMMLCRKPSTTVMNKRNTSFTMASNAEVTKLTGHPFAKPFELTRDLVEMISLKGQKILDPFMGGGSMVVEMLKMERSAFGCEKEDHWFNSALDNVKQLFYRKQNSNYVFK